MPDQELAQAIALIPSLLQAMGQDTVAPRDLVHALHHHGVGEEAARLGMWALIDRGGIILTDTWTLAPRTTHPQG